VRILVVDDQVRVAEFCRDSLEELGHDVNAVSSAPEALTILNREEIDLVLCDVRMPGMDGVELLRAIAASAIRAITDSAGKVKGLVDEVNEASKQQTQGIGQVATAVTQVSTVTQTAAASAEESAAAAQELSAQSATVSDLVRQLEAMVDGGHRGQDDSGTPAPVRAAAFRQGSFQSMSRQTVAVVNEDPFPMESVGDGSFRRF
jgi:CheY-like chemotaxis protein